MKKKIGMVGYFATGKSKSGGQEAKTCTIAEELESFYGTDDVIKIDTLNWKKHPIKLFFNLLRIGFTCKNIVMLPAQNSLPIFVRIFNFIKKFSRCRIHYVVIGGWLASKLEKNHKLLKNINKIDYIYVETTSMINDLNNLGVTNTILFPNFKHIKPLKVSELLVKKGYPIKICFFSRVIKEKGVDDIVNAVKQINNENDEIIFDLDVYGPVQPGAEEWFDSLKNTFDNNIHYRGFIEPNESVNVLKSYTALIFPTHYKTEGIPGTIIDAYSAGVPVITAKWINCDDVFEEGVTGWSYEIDNYNALVGTLKRLKDNINEFNKLKVKCLEKAKMFEPSIIMNDITSRLKD